MDLLISALCIIFACLIGVWGGVMLRMYYDETHTSEESAGSILIYTQDGEAYLFLDTELSPEELSKYSSVVLKVETRNVQSAL